MNISTIPVEVITLILGNLGSTRALYTAICSSPVFSRPYYESSIRVLTSIAENSIAPRARKHALAAIYAPCVYQEQRLEVLWRFLDNYFTDDGDDIPSLPKNIPDLKALLRLVSWVSRFERDYFDQTMTNIAEATNVVCETPQGEPLPPPPPLLPRPLSYTERTRIQRAFFRFEIYCRCFIVSESTIHLISRKDQFLSFLKRMQPWEVEEMACVHEYLSSRIVSIIDRIEDEFVSTVLEHQISTKGLWEFNEACGEEVLSLDACHERGLTGLDVRLAIRGSLFSAEIRDSIHLVLTSIVSHGLGHLTRILDAQEDAQLDLLLCTSHRRRHFLPEAIQYFIGNYLLFLNQDEETAQNATAAGPGDWKADDDSSHMSYGFSKVAATTVPSVYMPMAADSSEIIGGWMYTSHVLLRKELFSEYSYSSYFKHKRRLGYVFWDRPRIDDAELIFFPSDGRDHDHVTCKFDPSFKKPAEVLLRDLVVPVEIVQQLIAKYDGLASWDEVGPHPRQWWPLR